MILHFVATHKVSGQTRDFYYISLEQARYYNPDWFNWRAVGVQ